MRVDLTIEELILVDFDARARHRVAEAIERDLEDALTPTVVRRFLGTPRSALAGTQSAVASDVAAAGVHGIAAAIVDAATGRRPGRGDR